ncbi:MAG: hypothetical protein N2258_07290 [Brevinematales bacterium]|nr:hypothetical protein [Brevinematales bacterium]
MKVENVNLNPLTSNVEHTKNVNLKKDFSQSLNFKKSIEQGVNLPNNSNKEMIKDFAEWYFKQGQIYEKTKSYTQAISAYEKSNSVEPDINKAVSIEDARNKAYRK